MGEGTRARGGGSKGFGSGGVGGGGWVVGLGLKECVFLTFFNAYKKKFFEGFPVGWGKVQGGAERGPRALVPGG